MYFDIEIIDRDIDYLIFRQSMILNLKDVNMEFKKKLKLFENDDIMDILRSNPNCIYFNTFKNGKNIKSLCYNVNGTFYIMYF